MAYVKKIRMIYNDRHEGYINAIKELLGKDVEVVDRFYVAKLYRKGLDNLRKKEGSNDMDAPYLRWPHCAKVGRRKPP